MTEIPRSAAPGVSTGKPQSAPVSGPGYSFQRETDASGSVVTDTFTARSGVEYKVATRGSGDQTQVNFKVNIPQTVTGVPLEITGARRPGAPIQMEAHVLGQPLTKYPVEPTADNKYKIMLGPNGTVAEFDPQTLEVGIATPPTPTAGQDGRPLVHQTLRQIVRADNSRVTTAHTIVSQFADRKAQNMRRMPMSMATIPAGRQTRYVEVNETADGRASARQVVERQGPNGTTRQEMPYSAVRQADGSYTLSAAGLRAHMSAARRSTRRWTNDPAINWLVAQFRGTDRVPTFAADFAALTSLAAVAGPVGQMTGAFPFG